MRGLALKAADRFENIQQLQQALITGEAPSQQTRQGDAIQPHRAQAQNIVECPECGAKNQLNPGDDPNALRCGKCKGGLGLKSVAEASTQAQSEAAIDLGGYRYIPVEKAEGEAFCVGCGSVDSKDKLYHCREIDTYYHKECLIEKGDIQSGKSEEEMREQELAAFIGKNAVVYLTKFRKFNIHGSESFSVTWNWPAFLVPFWWTLYRKLYGWFFLYLLILAIPYANFIFMIVFGICGNYIYYKHVKKKLLKIKRLVPPSSISIRIAHDGGVSNLAMVPVVIALIGILAAIAIPQFVAYRARGFSASANSAVRNAYVAAQAFFSDSPGGTIVSPADLTDYVYKIDPNITLTVTTGTIDSIMITATHNGGGSTFTVDANGGITRS